MCLLALLSREAKMLKSHWFLKLFRSGEGEAKLATQGFKHVVERKRDEEIVEI